MTRPGTRLRTIHRTKSMKQYPEMQHFASPEQAKDAMHARKNRMVKKAKRRGKKRTMKKAGRPKGSTSRFGLKAMSLERLTELIDAARREARTRLADIEASIG